jgi:hypothetical protein
MSQDMTADAWTRTVISVLDFATHRSLWLACLAACALAACKEPQSTVDFSPRPGEAGTVAQPGSGGLVPAASEMSYAERQRPLAAGGKCNLERVNGAIFGGAPAVVSKAAPVALTGWIADIDAKTVPATIQLRFVATSDQRNWKANAATGEARNDVQALLGGDAAFAKTGYSAELDLAALPTGTYRVYAVFAQGQALRVCDNGRAIDVRS